MKIFNDLLLQFEQSNWARDPQLALIDTLLNKHPELYKILQNDILKDTKSNELGRKDTPSIEQIVRAGIYKEIKKMDYRELEYAQFDSKICSLFIKLDYRQPFSFQLFQKYISRISAENLHKFMVELNIIAINEGLEDIQKIRQDSTVIKTNIHYPTNNSIIWDCIKESHRLLTQLKEECDINPRNYTKSAKKTYFKINTTKSTDKRVKLFKKQLETFTKSINQVSNYVKKKVSTIEGMLIINSLEELLPLMQQVFEMSYKKEILSESVPNNEKLFSIYELHTDIIVKGSRDVQFGHKVNFAGGKSNLILDCTIHRGNPSDKKLYQPTLDRVIENYQHIPRDITTDGGYASLGNVAYSQKLGVKNIVFNKIVGSLQNVTSSKRMATTLKRWRSGIEAVISNLKRGYGLRVCNWKGWEHFQSKVLWSTIAYNIRVMTSKVLEVFIQPATI